MEKEKGKLIIDDTVYETFITKKVMNHRKYEPADPHIIRAIIPGAIREIRVKKGQTVKKHDELFILEAMKMRNRVYAPMSGKIKTLHIEQDQRVAKNDLLIEIE